ncbi:MAG TPA: MXAN_5187 C-terminal domain-containing protein [Thermoanaerobaculia bacterium]|nr:MXAN_5187 C-terminal domain-containing protein [Thermoanaerobaculia bacterium]
MTRPNNEIDRVANTLEELRIEFERYFNGASPIPPLELRDRIGRILRLLRERRGGTAVDHFRLSQLEARYNSYVELYNRRLRDREEGRVPRPIPISPSRPHFDAEQGVVLGDSPAPEAVAALYQALHHSGDGVRFNLESFGRYLASQLAAIREKTGCQEVQFRLVREDGQTKLRARPVRAV